MYTVFLSGFMGCGKTTAAQTFSRRTEVPFIDLDAYIERKLGATVADIFRDYGEEYFRKTEAECIKELCGKNVIVACGGGTMTDGKNYGTVKVMGGFVIFIDTPFVFCRDRIRKAEKSGECIRPLAKERTDEELEKLYNERQPLYEKNCDAIVTGVNPSLLIAADIMEDMVFLIEERTDKDIALVEKEAEQRKQQEADMELFNQATES
jgi:shikimate kinase